MGLDGSTSLSRDQPASPGVPGTGVAYLVWFCLLGRMSLLQLGRALFLVPLVGVVSGILTGDRPEPVVLAGVVALLAGVGLGPARRSLETPATPRI
jgi:drug/metabolite transporter (DMT)-like permease